MPVTLANIDKRVRKLEVQLKKILKQLDLMPVTDPTRWKEFTSEERQILRYLLDKKYDGATTTEIAKALNFASPSKSGRVLVWRRLRRISRLSSRRKGAPIVVCEGKRWIMNYDEFSFGELELRV